MLTRKDISRMLTSGLRTEFFAGYNSRKPNWKDMVVELKSTKAEESYGWLGGTPRLQEWVDQKKPGALAEYGFTAKNKDYEATLQVDRNAIDDDQYGQTLVRARGMGEQAVIDMERLFAVFVETGTTVLCYDGQYFFDTDHSEGLSGTQSNYTSSGAALSAANAKTIISTMEEYKDDKGLSSGITPTHIMVPPTLKWTALALFDPKVVSVTTDPATAVLNGALNVIVNPYLTKAGTAANSAYYIMDLSKAMKPFIFQNRKPITFVALDKDDDLNAFMTRTLYYGVEARFAFVFGDWRLCYKALG